MKTSEKITTFLGILLLFCAAFFLVSLMVQFLDFGINSPAHHTLFYFLGTMFFSVYGYSSFGIPTYLLAAALLLFMPKWTTRKGIYLAVSILPFFTLVATERASKALFSGDSGALLIVKVLAALIVASLVIAIEYLVAGILSDFFENKGKSSSIVKPISDAIITDIPEATIEPTEEPIPVKSVTSDEKQTITSYTPEEVDSTFEVPDITPTIVDEEKVKDISSEPTITEETEIPDIDITSENHPDYMDPQTQKDFNLERKENVVAFKPNEPEELPIITDPIGLDNNAPKDPNLKKEEIDALLAPYHEEEPVKVVFSVPELVVEDIDEDDFSSKDTIDDKESFYAEKNDEDILPEENLVENDEVEIDIPKSSENLNKDALDNEIDIKDEDLYNSDEAQFMEDPFDDSPDDDSSDGDFQRDDSPDDDSSDEDFQRDDLTDDNPSDGDSSDGDLPNTDITIDINAEQKTTEHNEDEDDVMLIPRSVPSRQRNQPYSIPTDILMQYPNGEYWIIDKATQRASSVLKETLNEFKIQAEVTGIRKGPVITMFEILPAPGVKLNKIVALQDNIALRLAASSVRIVAPIPGKSAVGIEVPNKERAIVSFKELIETDTPDYKKMAIPVVLGKDISGEAQLLDLTKTPHLLIAGSTGSGKSVCVNSMILSILYKRSPAEVRMILIDPKVVELKLYNDIPHLLTPVITEPKRAFQALQYCLCEMERRYALLDGMGVREINSYNRRIVERDIATEKLPYIVVVIDEFADLMATTGKELESTVARLAAMSRAVGIHLVLATQRPSIDVITGLIKANIPTRIAFMVASKMDSRIIIDQVGAEKLLGKGDMLYASATDPFPVRIQGTFVTDNEVENVVEYVKQYGEPEYIDDEIFVDDDEDEDAGPTLYSEGGEDPLYDKALDIVVQAGKASASYIQRRLKIGYNRAARLVEEMEDRGIVGPANGSKPREIVHIP